VSPAQPGLQPHERIEAEVEKLRRIILLPARELLDWACAQAEAREPGLGGEVRRFLVDPVSDLLPEEFRPKKVRRTEGTKAREAWFVGEIRAILLDPILFFTPARALSEQKFTVAGELPQTGISPYLRRFKVAGKARRLWQAREGPPCRTEIDRRVLCSFGLGGAPATCLAVLDAEGGMVNVRPGEERLRWGFDNHLPRSLQDRMPYRISAQALRLYESLEEERKRRMRPRPLGLARKDLGKRAAERDGSLPTGIDLPIADFSWLLNIKMPSPQYERRDDSPLDRILSIARHYADCAFAQAWDIAREALRQALVAPRKRGTKPRVLRMCWQCGGLTIPSRPDRLCCTEFCESLRQERIRLLYKP